MTSVATLASEATKPQDTAATSLQFVIGRIDAGVAVLISDSVHLIEFPSLLLPAGVGPGSIVNIACSRNPTAEEAAVDDFWQLQEAVLREFGSEEPQAPRLRVRNTTQTSVTLEWDKLELAKAKLLELAIWRNGARLTTIPNPLVNTSTKLSGLALDTAYTFHLVLKTSAGVYTSSTANVHTHTITDTSGISVCFGHIESGALLSQAQAALASMGARSSAKIQIDTTHFVATSSASPSNPSGGPGVEYQKALQLNIPVVGPEWVLACEKEKKLVPIANFYSVGDVNQSTSISSASSLAGGSRSAVSVLQQRQPLRRTSTVETTSQATRPTIAVAPAPPPEEAEETKPESPEQEPEAPPIITPYQGQALRQKDDVVGESEETITNHVTRPSELDDLVAGKETVTEAEPEAVEPTLVVAQEEQGGDESLEEIGL